MTRFIRQLDGLPSRAGGYVREGWDWIGACPHACLALGEEGVNTGHPFDILINKYGR